MIKTGITCHLKREPGLGNSSPVKGGLDVLKLKSQAHACISLKRNEASKWKEPGSRRIEALAIGYDPGSWVAGGQRKYVAWGMPSGTELFKMGRSTLL